MHRAIQPINQPPIHDSEFPNFIDAFIKEGLQEQSLTFAKPANRHTIIRRLYHDLLGLKPTYEEIKEFIDS